jgi:hypothetical protein
MAAFFLYASFPNSRIKPRAATAAAVTYQTTIGDLGDFLTLIAPANANRTYIILKNNDLQNQFWYIYAAASLIDPTLTATIGVPNQLIYNNVTNTLYQKQDFGTTTNWIIVQIEDVGERIEPLQSARLDSLESIYALSNSAIPAVPAVVVDVDEGRG